MSEIHSIVFYRPKWNLTTSKRWIKEHNLKPIKKVHITKSVDGKITQYRYRIKNPNLFKKFITKKTNDNINIIIGFK